MALFGGKKEEKTQGPQVDPELSSHIQVMPKSYRMQPATARREVKKEEQQQKQVVAPPQPTPPPVAPTPQTQPGQKPDALQKPPVQKKGGLSWFWIVVIVLLVIVIGAVVFVFLQSQEPEPQTQTPPVVQEPVNETPTNEAPGNQTQTPTPPEPPLTVRVLPSSIDTDNDLLTDVEEVAYQTEEDNPDRDADGFNDGTEVQNLYNPSGFAPVRIIDSGLVQIVQNEAFNYEVLIPVTWDARTLLELPEELVITPDTQTGEFFNVSIIENPNRLPLVSWYIRDIMPRANPGAIKRITNRRGELSGILSLDEQTVYFELGDRIYSIAYESGTLENLNYKTTFKLIYESFVASPLEPALTEEDQEDVEDTSQEGIPLLGAPPSAEEESVSEQTQQEQEGEDQAQEEQTTEEQEEGTSQEVTQDEV